MNILHIFFRLQVKDARKCAINTVCLGTCIMRIKNIIRITIFPSLHKHPQLPSMYFENKWMFGHNFETVCDLCAVYNNLISLSGYA